MANIIFSQDFVMLALSTIVLTVVFPQLARTLIAVVIMSAALVFICGATLLCICVLGPFVVLIYFRTAYRAFNQGKNRAKS